MAAADVAQPSRPLQHDAAASKSRSSVQARSRTPKSLEGPVKSEAKQSPHQTPVRPAPPQRSNLSNTSGSLSHSQSMFGAGVTTDSTLPAPRGKNEVDKEELTTKGRKRKRLAKACSACHKNKRRCDGFAPCSNCEFSARPCVYLNAQGEQIPPPRTRDSSATPMNKRPSSDEPGNPHNAPVPPPEVRPNGGNVPGSAAIPPAGDEWRRDFREGGAASEHPPGWNGATEARPAAPFSPIDVVQRDYALAAELIDIVMKHSPPYASMFHPPTFYHRYYLGRTSPILLDAMYCIGARLCENPAFVATYPSSVPSHLRGQVFADRCRANLDHIVELRKHWSDEEHQLNQGTWEETEFVQAALLLSVFYNSTRQSRLGLFALDVALSVLHPNSSGVLPLPSARLNLPTQEYFTLAEIRNRTFWLCVLGDICSAASGRPRRIRDHELAGVPLPGPEMHWARWGGMASGSREPGRRDCLAVGTGNWHTEEGQVGELGHIMRILSIFSNIMAITNNGGPGSLEARHLPAGHYEQALKAWALDLPHHLRFDEVNLSQSMAKLVSPVPEVAFAGWSFGYMHAVAECGMFYLQSRHSGTQFAVQRQGQAVDNLTVIIDSLGPRGRQGALMFFPIMTVTCWIEHLSVSAPAGSHAALDERLAIWWDELFREWGWERRETLERGIFPNLETPNGEPRPQFPNNARSPSSRRFLDAPPMYSQTSPRSSGPESSSSAASHTVVTPTDQSYPPNSRYPVLAPLPPRRGDEHNYHRTPSPSHGNRHSMSSTGSAGDREREGMNFPPIGYRGGAGPLVDREWDRERGRQPDLDRDQRGPPPRDHHSRSPRHKDSDARRHDVRAQSPRPLIPPSKRERERPWPTSMTGGPLLGIDALVSAAEEHRRENFEKAANASAITA